MGRERREAIAEMKQHVQSGHVSGHAEDPRDYMEKEYGVLVESVPGNRPPIDAGTVGSPEEQGHSSDAESDPGPEVTIMVGQERPFGEGRPSREGRESRAAPTMFVVPPTERAEGPQSTKAMRDMERSLNERQRSIMDREESLRERELAMRDRERWLREREQSMRPRDPREYPESPRHVEMVLAKARRPQMPRRTYSYGDSDEEFRAYDGEMVMPPPRSSPRWAETSGRRDRGDIGDQPMISRRRSDRSEDDDFDSLVQAPRPR